jgi:Zn-dependent membrane protease YugP
MSFLIYILLPLVLGLWAQWRVQGTYQRWSSVSSRSRITGFDAAMAVLEAAGIQDVQVVQIEGHLTDHYDPVNKKLALSSENYRGTSLAALGVAAHEAGHALQHQKAYAPLKLRSALIPVTQVACNILPLILIGGFVFPFLGAKAISFAVVAYLILAVFQLVTLPVEFDASARAKRQLLTLGILQPDEIKGVHETLDAAAWTYVAAFVASLGWLLYYLNVARDRE